MRPSPRWAANAELLFGGGLVLAWHVARETHQLEHQEQRCDIGHQLHPGRPLAVADQGVQQFAEQACLREKPECVPDGAGATTAPALLSNYTDYCAAIPTASNAMSQLVAKNVAVGNR